MKATKVNAGLAESNGRLLLGIWRDSLHVTCGLTACTPGSAAGPTLGNEYRKTLPFLLYSVSCISWCLANTRGQQNFVPVTMTSTVLALASEVDTLVFWIYHISADLRRKHKKTTSNIYIFMHSQRYWTWNRTADKSHSVIHKTILFDAVCC